MTPLIKRAYDLAMHAHMGQVRKYTGEPYFFHCAEVASLVQCLPEASDAMIAAAYCHDVLEDTEVSETLLASRLKNNIATEYVFELTDPKSSLNRTARKAAIVERYRGHCSEVQTIKLADLISNSRSILIHDKGFAKQYLTEKVELLKVLDKGNQVLYKLASKIVADSIDSLNVPV